MANEHSIKVTAADIRSMKGRTKIPSLTAYDYPWARLLDEAGIPLLLVGDSLGMVVLGYPDTTHVTMDDMIHHLRAVVRANPRALVAVDLPYRSYETPAMALANARTLVAAGAGAVKAEGGREIAPQIRAITESGVPFMGHLGMLPQHIVEEGGKYRIKGRTDEQRDALLADAEALVDAGAFGVVLELVTPLVAAEITRQIPIPTIGIGSGPDCDGQILVTHDLVGAFPWFTPKFVTPTVQTGASIRLAVGEWMEKVK